MRRLAAAMVVVIALAGAVYLGSVKLGDSFYGIGCGFCTGPSNTDGRVIFRSRADWQLPVSILVGVLGVSGGLVILRIRPKRPSGSATQVA